VAGLPLVAITIENRWKTSISRGSPSSIVVS
jgi:hypothetical protein